MVPSKTLAQREKELQTLLATAAGQAELAELTASAFEIARAFLDGLEDFGEFIDDGSPN